MDNSILQLTLVRINQLKKEIVVLNGTGSSDPNGKIVSYAWGIEDSDDDAPTILLNGLSTPIATFTAPMIAGNVSSNSYLLELTVMDNDGLFGSAMAV